MISVAPAVPPVSVNQCLVPVPHQCPSELPFSVTHQCQSVPPISAASQCHLSVLPSVAPNSASQWRLTVPVSGA
ncbi:unnamed protein product [Staurois parvus]|uniref:Uncharacterized protein n=1 Tax=Staurois parvus TaxID=386267 RepID=A0ABN9D6E9_9NEOB|nr:unnamed protein product [Staurois parvus]